MAYAELAGVPPVTGLYATLVPLVVYFLLGPSRILVLGPDSAVSPLVAELRRGGNLHAVNAYAYAHEEWMLATAWGPLLTGAIPRLCSTGARADDRPPALAVGARA